MEGSRLRIVPETRDLPDKRLLFSRTVKEGGAIFGLGAKRVSSTARTCQIYRLKPALRSVLVKLADGLLNCAKLCSTLKGLSKSPKTLRNSSGYSVMMYIYIGTNASRQCYRANEVSYYAVLQEVKVR